MDRLNVSFVSDANDESQLLCMNVGSDYSHEYMVD